MGWSDYVNEAPTDYSELDPRGFKQLPVIFDHIIASGRTVKDWTPADKLAKSMEELGELATAMLITTGRIKHKVLDEPVAGEVADVLICAIDVLQACYPNLNSHELEELLVRQLYKKSKKWRELIESKADEVAQ